MLSKLQFVEKAVQCSRAKTTAWLRRGFRFSVLLLVLCCTSEGMAATASSFPSSCGNSDAGASWFNTSNALSDNSFYAIALLNKSSTRYLRCTGYDFSSIPAGATIDGITVRVDRRGGSNGFQDNAMRLVKAGTIGATDRATNTKYTTSDVVEAHGGPTDLWGDTWTLADINNANFGAAFSAIKTNAGYAYVYVDYIQIVVDYTPKLVVSSINRAGTDPISGPATTASWTVTFNDAVAGVNAGDFALIQGAGMSGATIASVTGSGTTWTVTANLGSGTGTLGLNLIDDDSIVAASGGRKLGGTGTGNGNFTGQVYTISPPTVTAITRASANPTAGATSVSWTVVFSTNVTGVNATDFSLVQSGGMSGATLASVTGSGTIWTVTANTGGGTGSLGLNLVDNDSIVDGGGRRLGGTGAGNGNFTGQTYTVTSDFCSPPANAPSDISLTCVCDAFGRSSLNPSTIFGSNWSVSNSDGISNPYINTTTGLLRLTENTGNNAKAATVPGIFPAAGNYISVEFLHYAYNGSSTGADGLAVTLSDYSIPAVPGAFGGSLGYAQKGQSPISDCAVTGGCPGFAGGWIGVALDEYGNYQSSTEGRILGACTTSACRPQSVGVRGPGSGMNGYRWLGGTGSNPDGLRIDTSNRTSTTPGPGYRYQVIVDARRYASGTVNVTVNRDATTRDGSSYTPLFGPFNTFSEASYAVSQGWISKLVPDYWKISFTGSTGGSRNIHEIGSLRICAQTVLPPTEGSASGFSAIDEAYPTATNSIPAYQYFQTGNIYMKLTGDPFKLWVAALTSTGISSTYSASSTKYVEVKLVDNSDQDCGSDAGRSCSSSCTNKPAVEAGGKQIVSYTTSDKGAKLTPSFTLKTAWKSLIAVMRECSSSACTSFTTTAAACSADSFSVRPAGIASVTSSNASTNATTGTPILKAERDHFSLTMTTAGITGSASGYTGIPKIDNHALRPVSPATVAGVVAGTFPAATSGTPSSSSTGSDFTYSEVGAFMLPGYSPATNTNSPRGVYDGVHAATECEGMATNDCDVLKAATWTGADSVSTKADCIADSYANSKDTSGTYASNANFGKYGCNFGLLSDTAVFERFIPDHFGVTGKVLPRSDLAPLSTGVISLASPSILTVPSTSDAGKYLVGRLVRIPGAGAAGGTLVAKVNGVSGTSVSLDTAAVTAVTAVSVYPTDTFFYMGEPFLMQMIVTAYNGANQVTANYAGSLAKLDAATLNSGSNWLKTGCAGAAQCFGLGAVNRPPGTSSVKTGISGRLSADTGTATNTAWTGGSSMFTVALSLTRLTNPDGPFDYVYFGAVPRDADGVTIPASGNPDHEADLDATTGDTLASNPDGTMERRHIDETANKARFGRLSLSNAFGSEFLPLRVPVLAQYWTGNGWVKNDLDHQTNLTIPTEANGGLRFYVPPATARNALVKDYLAARMGTLSLANCCLSTGPSPAAKLIGGDAGLWLTSPITYTEGPGSGHHGYVDIIASKLNAGAWLPPTSDVRVCFGSCGPRSPVIYLRENY